MPVSSRAWLCGKEKYFQKEGTEGTLKFDGKEITFIANAVSLRIPVSNLKLVDLNNLVNKSQIVFRTLDSHNYIFVFYEPLTNAKALAKVLFYPKVALNTVAFRKLFVTIESLSAWKSALIKNLPPSKVQVRTELRVKFILVWTAIIIILVIIGFYLLILS